MATDEEKRRELYLKYKQRIEGEIGSKEQEEPDVPYSEAYRVFKKEQITIGHSLFEKLCRASGQILQLKLKQSDIDKLQPSLDMAHISTRPHNVYSFAVLSTVITMLISILLGLFVGNIFVILAGMLVAVGLFFYIPTIPKRMFLVWRAKASDQIVLAVLYMIIYMEHTPNLELSTWFAAKHLPPPLSLDFIKVLWDVETKKFSNISAALEEYIETWRGWDDSFIDAIHVMETSLAASSKQERLKILEKSEEIILEGTFDKMLSYAHNLQNPVQTLHMLGTVLPVMGLVMLPMVSAFMGDSVKWYHILLMYNILLPLSVYAISRSILSVRPAGANPSDVYLHLTERYARPKIPPALVGIAATAAMAIPGFYYFLTNFPTGRDAFATTPLIFSVLITTAFGFGIGVYYWYKVSTVLKIKKKIQKIEEQFAAAIFQLGNKVAQGIPVESAISSVIEAMPKAEVADFFRIIDRNIKELGMSLKEAIFDEKQGALTYFPSAIIKSVMYTMVEAAKKSPQIAASSLITISRYLTNAHRVNERLKDLLADTISSMSSQMKIFAPAISGIVVGLSALTTLILSSLGDKLRGFEAGADVPGFGTGLLQIFQIDAMIPSYQFQILVGVYLIQLTIIMSILLSGVTNGPDKIEEQNELAKNLLYASALYAGITIVTTLLFAGLVSGIVEAI
jgi:hypothetical protein